MLHTGYRNSRRPIPAPPSDPGSGQDPHDEEYMDARPDKEEMEEAIENFLSRLENKNEIPFCQSCPCLNRQQDGLCKSQRPLRLASSPNQTKMWWVCSCRQNYVCTVMHKITSTHIEKDIPCYPIFDWVYRSTCVVLEGGPLMNSKI